jgi:thiosulfate/3-mercaptopyruvate sulfurtransferase
MSRLVSTSALLIIASLASGPLFAAQPLVDGDWIEGNLGKPDVVVLDIRNKIDKGSREVYEKAHIPGAIYSNYLEDGWRAKRDGVVAMLPDAAVLEQLVGGLGIGNDDHVVIVPGGVSAADYGSATRVYWTFKVMGHDDVSILNGGYALWAAQGRAVEAGSNRREPKTFKVHFRPELVASRQDVAQVVKTGTGPVLIDNRPPVQYSGEKKSGSAARFGAIPGARNIPQGQFYNKAGHTFTDLAQLGNLWQEAGIANGSEQITYCNTGHWASLGWFASSELLGNKKTRMYDGSIADWSLRKELPMVNTKQ